MQIESNGEMGRCLQDNGFQDQALLPPFPHQYKVILERGLDFLIISISVPLFPWHNLRSIVIRSPEVASVINILRISV
jgi:hypothetical protein